MPDDFKVEINDLSTMIIIQITMLIFKWLAIKKEMALKIEI